MYHCKQCHQPAIIWKKPSCKMDCSYGFDVGVAFRKQAVYDKLDMEMDGFRASYANASEAYVKEFYRYNEEK